MLHLRVMTASAEKSCRERLGGIQRGLDADRRAFDEDGEARTFLPRPPPARHRDIGAPNQVAPPMEAKEKSPVIDAPPAGRIHIRALHEGGLMPRLAHRPPRFCAFAAETTCPNVHR